MGYFQFHASCPCSLLADPIRYATSGSILLRTCGAPIKALQKATISVCLLFNDSSWSSPKGSLEMKSNLCSSCTPMLLTINREDDIHKREETTEEMIEISERQGGRWGGRERATKIIVVYLYMICNKVILLRIISLNNN